MRRRTWLFALLLLSFASGARAHEVRPAYLELTQTDATTFDLVWKVPARGDLRLGLYVRLPASCDIVAEPRGMFVEGVYLERSTIRHPAGLVGETLAIDGLSSTMTDVLVRIERLDGAAQVARLLPASPSLVVEASPSAWEVSRTYFALGVEHILGGVDHLLFVLGLLFLVRDRWMLVKTITSFTVAHSVTLAIATLGYAHAPGDLLNALIAMSILFLGPEIVRAHRGETSVAIRHPWIVAFAFGLLHGFGFATGLQELGLPQGDIPLALLAFNLGVEAGQLGFVAALLAVGASLATIGLSSAGAMRLAGAYAIGSLGVFWTIDRIAVGLGLGGA
ncbi:MAG: HupE/UreJ family protein [Phycisphaerales bacterium]